MPNRFFVSVRDDVELINWIENVEPFLHKVMDVLCYDGEEISVLFCDDSFIKQLNSEYRNVESATDVLSFENGSEYSDEEGKWFCAGDIVISVDTLAKNAEYFGVDTDSELKRLLVHGILHLNGFDHGEEHLVIGEAPVCDMLVTQEKTLEKLSDVHIVSD